MFADPSFIFADVCPLAPSQAEITCCQNLLTGPFGRRVSFLAEGVKRDSEEAHLLKTVPSEGAWRSEDEGEETLLTSL